MTPIYESEGVCTPVVKPMKQDFSIDWDALGDVVDHLIGAGIHGLISGGSTGENYAMTVAGRIEVARFTQGRAKGRVR